jgi:hypothetical protein
MKEVKSTRKLNQQLLMGTDFEQLLKGMEWIQFRLLKTLCELDYSVYRSMSHSDDCIEVLVIRGAMLMSQFLEGNQITTAICSSKIKENSNVNIN